MVVKPYIESVLLELILLDIKMGKPYSSDLRIRVLKALDSGECLKCISRTFDISIKTIYLWRKQLANCGHLRPVIKYQKGHSHKIVDLNDFKKFIDMNNTLSISELAEKFQNISPRTIQRAITKIKYHKLNNVWISKKIRNV
jgi:transposase